MPDGGEPHLADTGVAAGEEAILHLAELRVAVGANMFTIDMQAVGARVSAFLFLVELGFLGGREKLAGSEVRSLLQF